MPLNLNFLAAIPLAIWLYLLLARGSFWRLSEDKIEPRRLEDWPHVVAVVPARNEATTISQAISSLAKQDYPGEFSIVVVDEIGWDHVETRRWRVSDGEMIRRWTLPGPAPGLTAVAFAPVGKTVAFGTECGMVRLFDLDTGKETTPTDQHTGSVHSIAFSADQKSLWTTASAPPTKSWRP